MVGRVQVERMGGAWGPNLWSSPQGPEPDRRVGGAWQDGGGEVKDGGGAVGGADEGGTPERDWAGAGPRRLTVATRYCRVPQSRTARLKRSSRYCKVPWARGH